MKAYGLAETRNVTEFTKILKIDFRSFVPLEYRWWLWGLNPNVAGLSPATADQLFPTLQPFVGLETLPENKVHCSFNSRRIRK